MLEIYNRKSFESNTTKKKNQGIIMINKNPKYIQNIIKSKKIKKSQIIKKILEIESCKIKLLRSKK